VATVIYSSSDIKLEMFVLVGVERHTPTAEECRKTVGELASRIAARVEDDFIRGVQRCWCGRPMIFAGHCKWRCVCGASVSCSDTV